MISPSFVSNILTDKKHQKQLVEWSEYKKWDLLYRATRDGKSANVFHSKCDDQGPTIVVIKAGNNIFGGYASCSWNSSNSYINAPGSWLFSLVNPYNNPPSKHHLRSNAANAMCGGSNRGPTFGSNHDICKF